MEETATTTKPAKFTVWTGYVRPGGLEVQWEFDQDGRPYYWVGVVSLNVVTEVRERSAEADSFVEAKRAAQELVDGHGGNAYRLIPVAQATVAEDGGMTFTATAMVPARELVI